MLEKMEVNTVCKSAKCPNIFECFGRSTATFMIMGNVCTRNCRFCGVEEGIPGNINVDEPGRIVKVVKEIGLKHIVVTSVTRDDLPDKGASCFAEVINRLKSIRKNIIIEILIPDFRGDKKLLKEIIDACPNIIGHNVETVPSLYKAIRPQADYRISLDVLYNIKKYNPKIYTKSGLMLGLGETMEQVIGVLEDLKRSRCDMITIGQYLRPSESQVPVKEYIEPDVFEQYRKVAEEMNFISVSSGTFVRSSYMSDKLFLDKVVSPLMGAGPEDYVEGIE